MKNIRRTLSIAPVLVALMLLAAPACLRADDAPKEKPLSKAKEKFDVDRDGKLSEEEAAAAKQAAREKAKQTREDNLAKYDADHDGKLSDEERARKKADEQEAREARKAERATKKAAREEAGR